ncbi:manganese efflux pump MntP family protein [Lachnospiraceae bacterium 62-35]
MGLIALLALAAGLSMDAFAVSICKGLAMKKATMGNAAVVGLWFGGFQALMPAIGYLMGIQFKDAISAIDHWIAFILLGIIGFNMIREAMTKEECEIGSQGDASLNFKEMFMMAVATSIDALAVGVTFAFLDVDIVLSVSVIGTVTFLFSVTGVKAGSIFGEKHQSLAGLAGGIILVVLGIKILLEHIGVF